MINCAVAGATGLVGQRFIQLLHQHPTLRLVAVAGSPERAGDSLGSATWHLHGECPAEFADLTFSAPTDLPNHARVIFSALPSQHADIERDWAQAGAAVFTNASPNRMKPDVPLVIAEINGAAMAKMHGGFIVANGNCSGIIATLPLAALHGAFGIEEVHIVTQQAISGAGVGGIDLVELHDNLLPLIAGEEEKLESEPLKTLGADFPIYATCTRVNVSDGHFASLHVTLQEPASWDEVEQALSTYPGLDLPTSPEHPILVRTEADRPQPRLDRDAGAGMSVTVGRIRVDGNRVRLVCLGHNTIRGAAGQSLLNAEWMIDRGLL